MKRYGEANRNAIVIEANPETGEKEARLRMGPLPNFWPCLIGDIIHNLRSALDHLATDAAKLNGQTSRTALSETYFPICASREALISGDGAEKMKRLSDAHRNVNIAFEPYKGGNDLLFSLHRLDIRDKHLMIVPAIGALVSNDTELRIYPGPDGTYSGAAEMRFGAITQFPLEDGVVLASFAANQPIEHVHAKATTTIAFGEGQPCEGRPILKTLDDMGTLISDIIKAFTANT
jgi:hypothetical protein